MKKHIPQNIFVLLLSLFLCVNMKSVAQTNLVPDDQEFQALKALYDSLGGPNWTNKTNWPTPGNWPATATAAQMGTWSGIVVRNGDIDEINLPANNLQGKIPAAISQLSRIVQLYLNDNNLTGRIPVSLGSLNRLLRLRLDSNALTGAIPASLGDLTLLKNLYLNWNTLTGTIPAALGDLGNLEVLALNNNQLSGTIPSTLGNLTSLINLRVSNNQLSGAIPGSLGNLSQLVNLYLDGNAFTGDIPVELGDLGSLQVLYLNGNALTGTIPAALGDLANLKYLLLQQNQFTGSIPVQLGNLANLIQLYLFENNLTGELPSQLGSLTKLQFLSVYQNQLTGSIPPTFVNLVDLNTLNTSENKLSGTVPEIFGAMTKLTTLNIRRNSLSGAFPSSIGNCTLLSSLNASNNGFTSLPASMLSMPALTQLDFTTNELVSIPDFSSQVNKASLTLSLRNNRLDFSHLEPLINTGISAVAYNAQKTINDALATSFTEGSQLVITARPTGQFSTITWEKQPPGGTWAVLANDQDSNPQTYTRTIAAISDEGTYRWKMTNTKVTGFTLQSDPITVKTPTRFALDDLAFQYKYDARKRMTHKKVPGADWVYMVYDNRDRMVMTQDGEQRKVNKWSFTKYDVLNRPVMTGIYTHNSFLDQAGMSALISTINFYETFTGTDPLTHGYSNTLFPKYSDPAFPNSALEILRVTYYDDYRFLADHAGYSFKTGELDDQASMSSRVNGQVTGVKTKTMGDDAQWLMSVNYFDDKYRPIQTVTDNHIRGIEKTTSVYDFVGKVEQTQARVDDQAIRWKDLVGVQVDGARIFNTSIGGWGSAGASSEQTISASSEGWVEFSTKAGWLEGGGSIMFGLSDQNIDANMNTIDYGIYYTRTQLYNHIGVYENGLNKYNYSTKLKGGETVRIERIGTTVYYKLNGIVIYTSSVASSSSLVADLALVDVAELFNSRISVPGSSKTVGRKFDYDHAGRLLRTWHSVNGAAPLLLAQNEYNELGQLITKKLHRNGPSYVTADPAVGQPGVVYDAEITSSGYNSAQNTYIASKRIRLQTGFAVISGNTFKARIGYSQQDADAYNNQLEQDALFKQVVNYRYNIRGWLTRVNDSDLSITENGPRDYFGMNLFYNETASGLSNQSLFNGNISAMKWSSNLGLGTSVPLLDLDVPKENGYTFNYDTLNRLKSASFYTRPSTGWGASTAYHEKDMKYDLNGNIRTLGRTTTEGALMDQLTYTYSGNQLLKVQEAETADKTKGFIDGPNPDNDYGYDANGNMKFDRNKDITDITYNHLNLPEKVTKGTGEYIRYTYDATGRKLSQGVYKSDNTLQKKTDYAGEFFYENDTLKFINHEEGRVVMTAADPEYQYHLKDHLGNVRLTFTSKEEETSATATLEEANAADEQGEFIYYNEAVRVYSRLFDHTNDVNNADGYAIRLTGTTTDKTYGLAKSLSVMPGDTVKMEVFAKYVTGTPDDNTWTGDLPGTMLSIANNTPGVMVDGGLAGSIGNQVFPFIGFIERGDEESTPPKAYLNWLVFDRKDSLVDFGYIPVTTAALENGSNGLHEHMVKDDLVVREPGYVYIYLSNENEDPVEVFFDDFKVEHVKSPVVQMDDYYPFGLTFNSYKRENAVVNKYQYNGIERVSDLDLGWYQAQFRTLDPNIGRWIQVDPKVDNFYDWTPYNSNLNNPVLYSDPKGDCPPGSPGCDLLISAAVAIGEWLNEPLSEDAQAIGQAYMISSTGTDVKPKVRWQLMLAVIGQASQHGVKPGRYNLKTPAPKPRIQSAKKITDPRFARRPKFKKQTEQDAVSRATDETGTLKCTKCDTELTGEKQENGKKDFQLAHPEDDPWVQQQDNWQQKADSNVDFSRGDVIDQYQKNVEVQCVNCNASDGGKLGATRRREQQ